MTALREALHRRRDLQLERLGERIRERELEPQLLVGHDVGALRVHVDVAQRAVGAKLLLGDRFDAHVADLALEAGLAAQRPVGVEREVAVGHHRVRLAGTAVRIRRELDLVAARLRDVAALRGDFVERDALVECQLDELVLRGTRLRADRFDGRGHALGEELEARVGAEHAAVERLGIARHDNGEPRRQRQAPSRYDDERLVVVPARFVRQLGRDRDRRGRDDRADVVLGHHRAREREDHAQLTVDLTGRRTGDLEIAGFVLAAAAERPQQDNDRTDIPHRCGTYQDGRVDDR